MKLIEKKLNQLSERYLGNLNEILNIEEQYESNLLIIKIQNFICATYVIKNNKNTFSLMKNKNICVHKN